MRKRNGSEAPPVQTKDSYKFMQTLEKKIYRRLSVLAKQRAITVQEYLRVIVIPSFLGLDKPQKPRIVPDEHKEWDKIPA